MAERYLEAAWRHLGVGEKLQRSGDIDDAGYHFGVSGENSLKALLQISGVQAAWAGAGVQPRATPMRGHFPDLHDSVQQAQAEISLYANGRLAGHVASLLLSPGFAGRFIGWHINIRYADTDHTPVTAANAQRWREDAEDFVLPLV